MYEINWEPSIAEQPTELSKDPAVGFTFYEGLFDTSVQTIEGVYEQVTKVGPVEPRQIDFMVQLVTESAGWSWIMLEGRLAERQGFEPWKAVTPCWFSRPVHSTALPSLRRGDFDEVRIQSQGNVRLFGTFGA